MTSITPIPSECTLEIFLRYEVFTINSEQIHERHYTGKNIIWIPTFKSEDPKEQAIYDKFRHCTYTYNGEEGVWYMGENKISFAPKIENWYQNYLKSRTAL